MGYTKIIRSGSFLEVYEYEKNLPIRRKSRAASRGPRYFKVRTRSADSLRRAKRNFRRLVQSNLVGDVPPALFTFTFLQVLSYPTSSRIFTEFIARLRRLSGRNFRYIAVPEFQERGAVHFHVLIWGFYEEAKKESTTRSFQALWSRGFVDGIVTDGHPKIAGYLTKYLSKSVFDVRLAGKKAYLSSHNILRPMSSASQNSFIKSIFANSLIPRSEPLQKKEFMTEWLGKCNYKSYKI